VEKVPGKEDRINMPRLAKGGDKAVLNRDEFVKEVTLRICSSLEIKESLGSAFECLKEQFPLDELFLSFLDPSLNAVRRIAYAGRDEVEAPDEIMPLPESVLKEITVRDFSKPFI
jgi:hypothetical protein